jgi:hypothetical protein
VPSMDRLAASPFSRFLTARMTFPHFGV